jgi:HAD superfamily hydrolase (TIGR01450 family)
VSGRRNQEFDWQDDRVSDRLLLCDLDGVIWLAHRPIAGSADAVATFREAGWRVVFVTNNSFSSVSAVEESLAAVGITAEGDVITSAIAGATLVAAGERVLVCGGPGIVEAVTRRGATIVPPDDADRDPRNVDAVIVGFHRDFGYETMRRASAAVRAGARLIGTNDDATYPTPEGPIPGGGSILAAVATASGVAPIVAGKPHEPMAAAVRELVGGVTAGAVMVGDRPSTDGRFARTLQCRYALVRSGVIAPGARLDLDGDVDDLDVHFDVADLADLSRMLSVR